MLTILNCSISYKIPLKSKKRTRRSTLALTLPNVDKFAKSFTSKLSNEPVMN